MDLNLSIATGRPSAICDQDCDVACLSESDFRSFDDFVEYEPQNQPESYHQQKSWINYQIRSCALWKLGMSRYLKKIEETCINNLQLDSLQLQIIRQASRQFSITEKEITTKPWMSGLSKQVMIFKMPKVVQTLGVSISSSFTTSCAA